MQSQANLICFLMFSEKQHKLLIETHKISPALLKHSLNDA